MRRSRESVILGATLLANRYPWRIKPISFQIGTVTGYNQSFCDISHLP
jgi:hypothetical protein